MRLNRFFVLALAAAGAAACSNDGGVGPDGNGAKTQVSIDVCGAAGQWFAYQNAGGSWTRIAPNGEGKLVFDATEKVSLATQMSAFGVSLTQIVNTTATELSKAPNVATCDDAGDKFMNGAIAGVTGEQVVRISAASSDAGANAQAPNWTLEDLPARPVDIVATRYATAFTQPANRVVVRRGIIPLNGAVSALDFTGNESGTLESATVTLTGADANGVLSVGSSVITGNGTFHPLGSFSGVGSNAFNYLALPAALRVANDIHQFEAIAGSADGDRFIDRYYKAPTNTSLAFGPMIGVPTISVAGSSPSVRLRAQFASQTQYQAAAAVDYIQSTEGFDDRIVSVMTTAGFLGSVPLTWELTIPDMSGAQYDATKGLQSGAYAWSVSAYGGDLSAIFGSAPTDGATAISATRYQQTANASFSRRGYRRSVLGARLPSSAVLRK